MSSAPTSAAIPFQTTYPLRACTRSSDISPGTLDGTPPASHAAKDYFQPHKPRPATDYFPPEPQISIQTLDIGAPADTNGVTTRTETKHEGKSANLQLPPNDTSRYSRNPLGMHWSDTNSTPAVGRVVSGNTGGQFASVTPRRVRQEDQAPDPSKRRFSVNFFKRRPRLEELIQEEKKSSISLNRPSWLRKLPSSRSDPPTSLADMPVPPTFVPPGLQRVPTPTFDAPAQVKGKLAGFFFDMHGLQGTSRRKPNAKPGRIWDSDAILMSMEPGLDLSGDDSDEAPEGRRATKPLPFHFGPVNDALPGIVTPPDLTPSAENPPNKLLSKSTPWFRMRHSDSSGNYQLTTAALKEADERRKFEWLVPEHLPNSPVCPLHAKYRGPSKGLCYWHGRKSNGYGVARASDRPIRPSLVGHRSAGSSSGWSVGQREVPKTEVKRRRLVSLSNP